MTDGKGTGDARPGGRGADQESGGVPSCPVSVCPVGMALTLAGQARPEVVEHLLNAGKELMLALTAFLNARAEALRDGPRLEKIEID
jgi:hypothetical protein